MPGDEVSIRLCMIVMGVCVVLVAISRLPGATRARSSGWSRLDSFGHAVQRWCPTRRPALGRWSRAGRPYQAAITGGIALGSWMWGSIANVIRLEERVHFLALPWLLLPLLGLWMRMPTVSGPNRTVP